MRQTAIVAGVGMTTFGKHLERGLKSLGVEAVRSAFADAGLDPATCQAAYVGNAAAGLITGQECIRGEVVLRAMGLGRLPVVNVENACASASTALHQAAAMVTGGLYDVVLALGVEKMYDLDKTKSFAAFAGAVDVEALQEILKGLKEGAAGAGAAAASEGALAPKPANLTYEQAASVPMAGLVALQALRDHGKVRAGQKVLINGASGGIGTFAVQIAKSLGAHVTGVCGTRNVDLVRSLGADHVIDYSQEDFTRSGQRYDFILDNVANHSLTDLRRALTPTGTLVPNGGGFNHRWVASGGRLIRAVVLFRFGSQRLGRFLVSPKHEDLVVLKELIEAGKVTPVLDHAYPLSDTRQAIDHVAGGHARGKVAITVSQEAPVALPAVA